MTEAQFILAHNTTVTKNASLEEELAAAKKAGYKALELHASKLMNYLNAGNSIEQLKTKLLEFELVGLGFLQDFERPEEEALLSEARDLFELAKQCGFPAVQILSGPLDVNQVIRFCGGDDKVQYAELLQKDISSAIDFASNRLKKLSSLAEEYGIILYIEALGWTQLNKIEYQIEAIKKSQVSNIKLIVDFWHCYVAGNTPADIAEIDKELIYGVHICDSLEKVNEPPIESQLRNVITGEGVLNLIDWVNAIKETGYNLWWASETFSESDYACEPELSARKHYELVNKLLHLS